MSRATWQTPLLLFARPYLKKLYQSVDEDNDGELDLFEFQHLVQLVSEKLRSLTRFREMELGQSHDIPIMRLLHVLSHDSCRSAASAQPAPIGRA